MQGLNWRVEVSLDNGGTGESLAGQALYMLLSSESIISITGFNLLDPFSNVGYVFDFNIVSQPNQYRLVVSSPQIYVSRKNF